MSSRKRDYAYRYKRAFDLVAIIASLILLSPLFLLLWIVIPLAIWLSDRGPVFFTQERPGLGGKLFKVIKFRTMSVGADAGPHLTSVGDDRTTRIGEVLRALHIDEMPQIINVIRSEMSLVGPRACSTKLHKLYEESVPSFSDRLRTKPGIIGLAQVRGDYYITPRAKLRYDNFYIKNMSIWMDLKLCFGAVWVTVKRMFIPPPPPPDDTSARLKLGLE